MKEEPEISLPNIKFKPNINTIIIVLATLIGLYLILPLFSSGIPLNIDNPAHYLREYCLSQSGIAPNNWCPYINAGVPTSQYYHPIIDQIIALLGKLISLELAYKIILLLAYFSVPLGALFLLREMGYKLSGSIAYAFLLFQQGSWHAGGLQETVLVGFWHYMITVGVWFFAITFFIKLLNEPNKKNLFFASIATLFITHPMTLVFGFFSYLLISAVYYKKIIQHWKWIAAFAAFSLLLNAYYLIPLMFKMQYFPSELGGTMRLSSFNIYIYSVIPKTIFVLFALGLIFYLKQDKKKTIALIFAAVIMNIIFQLLPFLSKFAVGIRLGAFLAPFFFIFAAILLEYVFNLKLVFDKNKIPMKFISIIAFLILAFILMQGTLNYRNSIMNSEDKIFEPTIGFYESLNGLQPGRILAEDTLYTAGNDPISFTHIPSIIPVLSQREIITFGTYFFPRNYQMHNVGSGALFTKKLSAYTQDELKTLLNTFNIKYVLLHNKDFFEAFKNLSKSGQEINDQFIILEMDIEPSYFSSNAKLSNENYEGIKGSVFADTNEKTDVLMKVNYYPNWMAYVDGQKTPAKDCNGFVCVQIENPSTIEFKYESLGYEKAGYAISLISLIVLILILKKNLFFNS